VRYAAPHMDSDAPDNPHRLDSDAQPDLDPEPIPNIVLHPGDTLAFSQPYPDNPAEHVVRLSDRNGVCYAVLDCDPVAHGVRIAAIRYVADQPGAAGRELLPLPAEPLTVAGGNTISVTGPLYGPYEYTLIHRHSHTHLGDGITYSHDDWPIPHAHDHQHTGADAASANAYGHATAPHTHQHDARAAD